MMHKCKPLEEAKCFLLFFIFAPFLSHICSFIICFAPCKRYFGSRGCVRTLQNVFSIVFNYPRSIVELKQYVTSSIALLYLLILKSVTV